jgi:cytochrome c oxidase assembly protein Cox11
MVKYFTYTNSLFLVPTSPPSGFLSTEVTVTTITIGWGEIPLRDRHGIITGYELTYKKTTTRSKRDVEKTLRFDANTHSAFLYKLTAYTNYTITLRGRTSVGYGVKGEVIIETLQGGK